LFKALFDKLLPVLHAIVDGKEKFDVLRDSFLLEILMLADLKTMSDMNNQLYKQLHTVLEK
jgi:hypothetical protein